MKCPICKLKMRIISKDKTFNSNSKQLYDRVLYECKADDVWITLELPEKKINIHL